MSTEHYSQNFASIPQLNMHLRFHFFVICVQVLKYRFIIV